MAGDKVILNPVQASQPLHVSEKDLSDNPGCREVNAVAGGDPCPWKVCIYMEYADVAEECLKSVSSSMAMVVVNLQLLRLLVQWVEDDNPIQNSFWQRRS